MKEELIYQLADIAGAAQVKIQQDFKHIDPIVGISRHMRKSGFPIDAMMIDCLSTGKRILILLNDEKPECVSYQFCFKDKDPELEFDELPLKEIDETKIYSWIQQYFA